MNHYSTFLLYYKGNSIVEAVCQNEIDETGKDDSKAQYI